MIRVVSKVLFVHPEETVAYTVSLKTKISDHANFSIENANPGGFWGSSIQQLPKDTAVPGSMIVIPFSGVVHSGEPSKLIEIKYLYPTWVRVVQYLSEAEITSVSAKIKVDTSLWTRIKRLWRNSRIEPPTERIF